MLFVFIAARGCHRAGTALRILAVEIHFRKASGKVIEVVLSVAFQRMVVATGASNANSEKRLCDAIGQFALFHFLKFADNRDEIARLRLRDHIPSGQQHVASNIAPPTIRSDLVAQPLMKRLDSFLPSHIMITLFAVL